MENPFKKIEHNKDAPEHIKKKVMNDIAGVKFLMEVTSLFSSNYLETTKSFFKKNNKKDN